MTNPTVLPLPESTYQLLLNAARTWPGAVATQWIPDPSDHTRCRVPRQEPGSRFFG